MSPEMLRLISEQRGINKEFDRRKPISSPTVFNNDSTRPAARDNAGRIIFVRQADGSFQGQFSNGADWVAFLASATSFDTPAITYGTTASSGSGIKTIRSNSRLLYPNAVMSSANLSTLTLTDDGTNQFLTGNLGYMYLDTATHMLRLPMFTHSGAPPDNRAALLLAATTSNNGDQIEAGYEGGLSLDGNGALTNVTKWGAILSLTIAGNVGHTLTNVKAIAAEFKFGGSTSHTSNTHVYTERTALRVGFAAALQSGTGVVTVNDNYGIVIEGWPLIGTAGTQPNSRTARFNFPTLGSTIRRGVHVATVTSNVGTESANSEGVYVDGIKRGTAQRANFYAEGASNSTPTDVYAFYQGTAHTVGTNRYGFRATGATTGTPTLCVAFYADAHSVGTTQWAFYSAGDESHMAGVQQDDNAKDVYGTGRDAEIYYDGTDLIVDPDAVGTGVLNILGGLRCDSIQNDTGLASGVYTPTRSAEANLDANVTMTEAQYLRVGNTVTVSGRFTADPTLTATTTSFEMTLPVASNIGAAEDVAGTAFCGAIAAQGAEIIGVAANDTAKVQWKAGDVTSQTWSFVFTYQVI